ncbi:MAG TPA: glycosyltransferase family 2 protein [Terriglobales bacterium]|nr:glycosyltransferase family 2 protein [Terriglobales bacterium]
MTLPSYVLITPARNEAQFIELTIKSVVAQTVRPARWVIVSDGSTDGTDEIVGQYAAVHPWIELVRMPERRDRHFAGKVYAFNAAYARLRGVDYEVIASLDADISFDEEYFSFLLRRLAEDSTLGLVGTPFKEERSNQIYDYRFVSIEHVSGACQVFRRQCFEDIGGYTPVKGGGVDYIMVVTARMKGWKTRTFTEKTCLHHREIGTAQHNAVMARFKNGVKDYAFGNHPIWEVFRMIYQSTKRPFVLGGVALMSGYLWAAIRRAERLVSRETVAFCRREQIDRLKRFVSGYRRAVPAAMIARDSAESRVQ